MIHVQKSLAKLRSRWRRIHTLRFCFVTLSTRHAGTEYPIGRTSLALGVSRVEFRYWLCETCMYKCDVRLLCIRRWSCEIYLYRQLSGITRKWVRIIFGNNVHLYVNISLYSWHHCLSNGDHNWRLIVTILLFSLLFVYMSGSFLNHVIYRNNKADNCRRFSEFTIITVNSYFISESVVTSVDVYYLRIIQLR
jgi:hypothetical protein